MSAWNSQYDDDDGDEHRPCASCGEEHPVGVLDDELCPACVDDEPDGCIECDWGQLPCALCNPSEEEPSNGQA